MPNPTYPNRIGVVEMMPLVVKGAAVLAVYNCGPATFCRLELGDERPAYAWSKADDAWVKVNITRAKDV